MTVALSDVVITRDILSSLPLLSDHQVPPSFCPNFSPALTLPLSFSLTLSSGC